MAEDSLYDFISSLNRWFWRIELPFEKSDELHGLHCAVLLRRYGFLNRSVIQGTIRFESVLGRNRRYGSLMGNPNPCTSTACDRVAPPTCCIGEVAFAHN